MSGRQPVFTQEFAVDAAANGIGTTDFIVPQQRGPAMELEIYTSNTTLANLRDVDLDIYVDGDEVYKDVSLLRFFPTNREDYAGTKIPINCPPGGTIQVRCDNTAGAGTIELQVSVKMLANA